MAYPPFYSSFTPPFYSFHHQPGVINFTHLCSPSPNLHYQDLNPIPAPSHHLHYSLAPYSFNCIDTVTVTTPQISQTSFHQLPTLTNSTNLNHSFSYQQYQDPIPPPDLSSLQTNIEPLFLVPPVKRDDEGKSQARITGSKFSTIADEKNFSDIANFSTPAQSVAVAQVVKGEDEETVKSQDLIAAKAKSQAAEPHQDPPSNFRVTPQFTSFTSTQPSLPSSLDGVPTVRFSGSKNRLDFAFITPDRLHPPCFDFKALPTGVVARSSIRFSGPRCCFDFLLLGPDLLGSSCFELETVAWETTVPSPAKTKGNAFLVFDPGGGCDSGGAPPKDTSYFKWRRESSAYGGSGGSSSTMATRPPATASFLVKEPPPGPASALPWVPWDFGTQDES